MRAGGPRGTQAGRAMNRGRILDLPPTAEAAQTRETAPTAEIRPRGRAVGRDRVCTPDRRCGAEGLGATPTKASRTVGARMRASMGSGSSARSACPSPQPGAKRTTKPAKAASTPRATWARELTAEA